MTTHRFPKKYLRRIHILKHYSLGTITTENKRLHTTTRIACNLISRYVQCGRYDMNQSLKFDYQPGSSPFNLYFRAILTHHMIRFSSYPCRTEAAVPKMYPHFLAFTQLKITLFSVFRKMLLHHSASVNKDNTDSY